MKHANLDSIVVLMQAGETENHNTTRLTCATETAETSLQQQCTTCTTLVENRSNRGAIYKRLYTGSTEHSVTSSEPKIHWNSWKSLVTLLMLTKFGDVCLTPHSVGILSLARVKKAETSTETHDSHELVSTRKQRVSMLFSYQKSQINRKQNSANITKCKQSLTFNRYMYYTVTQ